MSDQPHAFVSYVREDKVAVDQLCRLLENANIPYWRDRKDLGPGDEWKAKIRDQIRQGSFVFLACFSENYHKKPKSTMNEELLLAVEEFRKMTPGQPWIIPIRFADVELPPHELRPNLMLADLNYVSLFGEELAEEAVALTSKVTAMLGRTPGDPAAIRASVAGAVSGDRVDLLRRQTMDWILDPARRIAVSQLVGDETRRILSSLSDEARFPMILSAPPSGIERGLEVGEQARAVWELTAPFLASLEVAVRWGGSSSLEPWMTALRAFCLQADSIRQTGGSTALISLRHLPVVVSAMTVGFAAVRSQQWGNLRALLTDVSIPGEGGAPPLTVLGVSKPWSAFDHDNLVIHALARAAKGDKSFEEWLAEYATGTVAKMYTPIAEWLFEIMRPILDDGILGEDAYARDFDRAEVMLGILAEDQVNQRRLAAGGQGWFAHGQWFGRSTWRAGHIYYGADGPVKQVESELRVQGLDWAPLRAGLFGGDVTRAMAAIETYSERFDLIARDRS